MNDLLFQSAFKLADSNTHFVTSSAVIESVGGPFSIPILCQLSLDDDLSKSADNIPSCLTYLFDIERR